MALNFLHWLTERWTLQWYVFNKVGMLELPRQDIEEGIQDREKGMIKRRYHIRSAHLPPNTPTRRPRGQNIEKYIIDASICVSEKFWKPDMVVETPPLSRAP